MENRKTPQKTQNEHMPEVLSTRMLQHSSFETGPNYLRLVYQPILNGLTIGPSLYVLVNAQTKLQNRPADMSLWQFCKTKKEVVFANFSKTFSKESFASFTKNVGKASTNKSIFQTISSMFYVTSDNILKKCHHTFRGVFNNTQNSIFKSVFSANAPMVQRHIHEHVNATYREKPLEEAAPQANKQINDIYLDTGLIFGMSGAETIGTAYFANRVKCDNLVKEVYLPTFMDKVKFARLAITARFGKTYYTQGLFLLTDKIAKPLYGVFPKEQYGFLALGLASTVTGCAVALGETAHDVVYTKRFDKLKTIELHPGKFIYEVPTMRKITQELYSAGGARIFTRGLVTSSVASCAVIGITKWIGQKLDELENIPPAPTPAAGTAFTLFGNWNRRVELLDEPETRATAKM